MKTKVVRVKKKDLKQTSAWKWFSKWVRFSNADHAGYVTCYTCSNTKQAKEMHAGHYIHARRETFFDEMNVHPQCNSCNTHKSGNLDVYCERLMNEYGVDAVNELRRRSNEIKSFYEDEITAISDKYRELCKGLDFGF